MEHLAVNAMGRARVEVIDGRKHIVAPLSLIVPGVLAGSKGALKYPEDEVAKGPERWDKVPLVVYHPTENGKPVSVTHPGVLEKSGIGFTRNAGFKSKLHAEGCFDVERVRAVDATLPEQHRILPRLKARKPIELSTGLFTDNMLEGDVLVARNYRPDHIAILPDQEGACGIKHGCGVHNVRRKADKDAFDRSKRPKNVKAKRELRTNSVGATMHKLEERGITANAFSAAARQAALLARKRAMGAKATRRKAELGDQTAHKASDAAFSATLQGDASAKQKHMEAARAHGHAIRQLVGKKFAVEPASPEEALATKKAVKQHKAAAKAHVAAYATLNMVANCKATGKPGVCKKAGAKQQAHEADGAVTDSAAKHIGAGAKLKRYTGTYGHDIHVISHPSLPKNEHGKREVSLQKDPHDGSYTALHKGKGKAFRDSGRSATPAEALGRLKSKLTTNQETVTMPSKLEELTANCKGMSDEQIQRIIDNVNKKPMTDAEWLASAPPGVQVAVNNAMAVVADERKACITKLVGNAENKEALAAVYDKMDLPALRTLASQIVPPARNNFAGTAPAVPANNAASVVDEKDILPLPVMNWSQSA